MIPLLVAAALLGAPAQASASVAGNPLQQALYEQLSHGLPAAAVGQWVTYTLRGSDRPNDAFWRLAIVGKQKDKLGRDAVWLEMEVGQHANFVAPLFQMKLLVASQGGLQADGISRAIMAVGAGQPQEIEPASLAGKNGSPDATKTGNQSMMVDGHRLTIRSGKRAQLMTGAGTVDATPVEVVYRQTVIQRFWMSKEIPVLQLAKIEIPHLEDMLEVRDYGLDAKPMIHFPDPNAPKISLDPGAATEDGGTDEPAQAP